MWCPDNAAVYGLISLAQNGGKGSGVLTELGFEGEGRAKTMAMLTGSGVGTVITGGVRRPFSGRLDSAGRLVGHLRGCHEVRKGWKPLAAMELPGGAAYRWWGLCSGQGGGARV